MSVESAFYGQVSADAAVIALISDRLYPLTPGRIAGTIPFAVYQRVNSDVQQSFDTAEYAKVPIRVDVYAEDINEAISVADAIKAAIADFTDANVSATFWTNEFDVSAAGVGREDVAHRVLEFELHTRS